MTATIHGRLLMLGNGCRCHDYGGWTRESCQWFEMNGMVRRLYIGDGLAVNAHEDRFLGDGIDSISVSGRGVNIMLNVDGTGIAFFHQGFEYADYWRHFRVRFSSDDTRGVPSLPQNIAYDGGWDPGEVRRLLSVVCHGDVAAVSDDPVVRLGDGLSVTVDTEAPGPPGFPQADLVYRQGAVSVELRGTLSRCREGVAVVSKFESFAVIALPGGSADAIGGAVTPGYRATLRYLNSNLDAYCEGPWYEGRTVQKDFRTGDEPLYFPFPAGLHDDPGWRDAKACLGIDGSYDCDLFRAGPGHDVDCLGRAPGSVHISFVFKPTGFRVHDWRDFDEPTMSQPLTEGELRHMMRLCRAHIREHPQDGGDSADDD